MTKLIYTTFIILLMSCNTTQNTVTQNDLPAHAVRIANDELAYQIVIIDIGFDTYLDTAKPMNYYSESILELKNRRYVTVWNQRARNLTRYNPKIYENVIDYDFNTHYGLEVNYKLYQYFKFVEHKYKERF